MGNWITGAVFFLCIMTSAAQTDSLKVSADSLGMVQMDTVKKNFFYKLFKEDYPNPRSAGMLSLAIPGGGQIYNKRYW